MATSKRSGTSTTSRRPSARPRRTRRPATKPETFWTIQAKERRNPTRTILMHGGGSPLGG